MHPFRLVAFAPRELIVLSTSPVSGNRLHIVCGAVQLAYQIYQCVRVHACIFYVVVLHPGKILFLVLEHNTQHQLEDPSIIVQTLNCEGNNKQREVSRDGRSNSCS